MKKRIMTLVLVSVLVLSAAFTGCSSQTEEENPQNSSQSSQAEEPESSSETLNSNWLIVQSGGESERHILEIDETSGMPIQNIAG